MQCLCGVPLNKTEPPSVLASYSSLLTPAFVACSTNVGEGLVKLMTCSDISRRWVDMRRSGTFPEKPWVCYRLQPQTMQWLRDWHQAVRYSVVWVTFLGFRKLPHSYIECATPPHVHPTSRYVTVHGQFYPHISTCTSSDQCWGRRPGYEATSVQGWLLAWSSYWSSVCGVCLHTRGLLRVRVDICVASVGKLNFQ